MTILKSLVNFFFKYTNKEIPVAPLSDFALILSSAKRGEKTCIPRRLCWPFCVRRLKVKHGKHITRSMFLFALLDFTAPLTAHITQ